MLNGDDGLLSFSTCLWMGCYKGIKVWPLEGWTCLSIWFVLLETTPLLSSLMFIVHKHWSLEQQLQPTATLVRCREFYGCMTGDGFKSSV